MRVHTFFIEFVIVLMITSACTGKSRKPDQSHTVYRSISTPDSLHNLWQADGAGGIVWNIKQADVPHTDHLEFSGLRVSSIVTYGVDEEGHLVLKKRVLWPMLRTIPNDTHASLHHDFDENETVAIFCDGKIRKQEMPYQVKFNGVLTILSHAGDKLKVKRILFPSTTQPAILEMVTVTNISGKDADIRLGSLRYEHITPADKGVYGAYTIRAENGKGTAKVLKPGESISTVIVYSALKAGESLLVTGEEELKKREDFIRSLNASLVLETPDPMINQMFRFAKLRATESIYATRGGLMHSPGGGRYYAAIWANDQAEYVNPFFPYLGNKNGNESAINSFRLFSRYMNPGFKPVPSSIIAEGTDIWNGAGDRGDAAMIAYGASRFALAYGDPATSDSLLPLIKWCLKYCEKKMLPEGVVASDCDELEGRFPAGKANLSTNMLAYGAFRSAVSLLCSLGKNKELAGEYERKAEKLREDCEKYFGGNVQGFDTYRYFKDNKKLRSWICLPLVMGIDDRKEETLKAIFSPYLWNKNGIFTQAGDSTFWDRATLYAFRGVFYAGETDIAMKYFKYYSQKRLLGEHVPYAVEAWPEGNQRHLSAESGLYARVITEGLFGIDPTGLRSFTCAPRLPSEWHYMKLKHIKAFHSDFDIVAERKGDKIQVTVMTEGKPVLEKRWDGKQRITVEL
ncbi:MAG: hypothetical protein J7K46_05790 [Bacteroidales bacterium]|nr:hypothetical protein [Bacteroidales bacterium]